LINSLISLIPKQLVMHRADGLVMDERSRFRKVGSMILKN
jgi:hypothetical protein